MLNKKEGYHLYQQIRDDIIKQIESGQIKEGSKLGTEKDLTEKYKVSRPTVRQALKELEELNLVKRLLGKGTFVKQKVEKEASSRLGKNNKVIAVIVPILSTTFVSDIITGAQQIIDKTGYSTKLYITNNSVEKEAECIKKAYEEGVSGIILHPTKADYYNNDVIKISELIPIIMTGRYYRYVKCNYVVANNYNGVYHATQYLIDNGHSRIGLVSREPKIVTSLQDRIDGYKNCLQDNGILIDKRFILSDLNYTTLLYPASTDKNRKVVKCRIEEFLLQTKNILTAVIAVNDLVGTDIILTAKKIGIEVPKELSVIGFDNVSMTTRLEPPLTTVDWSRFEIGKIAAGNLIKLIEKESNFSINIDIPVSLIKRKSVCTLE